MNWRKIALWAGSVVVALLVLLVVAVVVLTRSEAFHHYILAKATQSATEALGTRVSAQGFRLRLSPISLELNGVRVEGTRPEAAPLLTIDHASATVRIISVFKRKWQLEDLTVDRPIVHLYVDKGGNNNLPKPKSKGGSSNTNLFDLGVQHAALNNGEVYYNDQKSGIDADLHELQFNSSYEPSDGGRYFGDLSYTGGHLHVGTYAPMPHAFQAHFDANRSGMKLQRVLLASGDSNIRMEATVDNYDQPTVHATYNAVVDATEFKRILKNASLPSGVIRVDGNLQYQNDPNRPLIETTALQGTISSPSLRVTTPQLTTDITSVSGNYAFAHGNASVTDLRARVLGGQLTAQMVVRNVVGDSSSHLQATLRGVSLDALNPAVNRMANSPSVRPVSLSGTANIDADARWGRTMADLVATANADLSASIAPATSGAPAPVPVNGAIHAGYAAASGELTLTNSSVRTPETSIALNGTVSNRSSLGVQVVSNNLHELETLANAFTKAVPGQQSPPLGLAGKATFNGSVTGSTRAPHVSGRLVASNLQVKNSSWKLVQTDVDLSPSRASLRNGQAVPAKQGRITFNVQTALNKWSFTETSPLQANVNISQLSAADIAQVAGSTTPVSGTLNGNLDVRGSQANPVGQGKLTLTNGRISGETIQAFNVQFQGTGQEVHARLNAQIPAGAARGNIIYYPKQKGYDLDLQAPNIRLDQVKTLAEKNLGITGQLSISATGRGTMDDPQLHALISAPQLSVRNQKIDNLRLEANVQNKMANVAFDSSAVNTSITGRAQIALRGDYPVNATIDTKRIPLQPFVAMYSPAQAPDISGETELHATVRGPLKNKAALQAQVEVSVLTVNYKTIQLGAVSPIRANYTNGVATIEPAEIRGTGTDLRFRGTIPVADSAPASLLLLGTVDLRLLQLADPTIDSSGQLQFNINSFGARTDLNTQGQIRIVNASMVTAGSPIGLQNANGVLTLRNDRVEVSQFHGNLGGGDVTARGALLYRNGLKFDLAVAANGVRVAYPQGVRTGLNADITLTGTSDNSLLRGNVEITGLYFTPDFDVTSFASQFSSAGSPPSTGSMADNMKLNVAVQSTSQLNAVSRTVSLQGSANLRVAGTAANPVVLGRVNLTGGDLLFSGNRYVVQGGTIAFINAIQTEPVLNVQASTTIQQYNIQMSFQGPLNRMRTNYTSDPALPPVDIIHLLAFGSTTESAAANPTPGNLGAQSVIAQQLSNQVTSRLQKVAGISHLSVDPTLGSSNQGNPGARISVQQRVTGNLFVTFESDVTSTERQQIQVQYQINPRWSVSGTRDQNGGFGFDARVHKTF